MKEYRNAVRSKKLIRGAFIELLSEKDISKITVVDVVKRAELSRNTFYAHYQDVYAVLEEIENDFIIEMNRYLDDAIKSHSFMEPLPLLEKFQKFIEKDLETNKLLLANQSANVFCEKLKRIFIARVVEKLQTTPVKDTQGFLVFLECLTGGFISLYQKSLKGETSLTLDEVTKEINKIFVSMVRMYF